MAARLNKQLQMLEQDHYIVDKKTDFEWRVYVGGPEQTPFEGGQFVVNFKLDGFPFKAPVVSFQTKIYHPNVDDKGGICADMLEIGQKWAPVKNLIKVMDKIKSLLVAPNIQNPMNPQAAKDYKDGVWAKKAKQYTVSYAK